MRNLRPANPTWPSTRSICRSTRTLHANEHNTKLTNLLSIIEIDMYGRKICKNAVCNSLPSIFQFPIWELLSSIPLPEFGVRYFIRAIILGCAFTYDSFWYFLLKTLFGTSERNSCCPLSFCLSSVCHIWPITREWFGKKTASFVAYMYSTQRISRVFSALDLLIDTVSWIAIASYCDAQRWEIYVSPSKCLC